MLRIRNKRRSIYSPKIFLLNTVEKLDQVLKATQDWQDIGALNEFEKFVIVIEDRRYFRHSGIDFVSVLREVLRLIFSFRRPYGASTLEMQFVRTILNDYRLSLSRKSMELKLAWLLNFHVTKKTVLRSYLDIAYFGTGMVGCDEAAHKLFGLRSSELQGYDAAFLASCLVNPIPKDASNIAWRKKVDARAKRALHARPRFEKAFNKVEQR